MLAATFCPRAAAHTVARRSPIPVAVRMIGRAALAALEGTYPIVVSPSPMAPAITVGIPIMAGSPARGLGSGVVVPTVDGCGDRANSVSPGADALDVCTAVIVPSPSPEPLGGQLGPLGQCGELGPGDIA